MDKNKDVYMNYICPYCWNTLDNCICDLFPPYHLIFIDKNIQEHIRVLNEKGYRTTACCEAHMDVCFNTYIAFADDYFDDTNAPDGFKYDRKRRMVTYTYSTKLTEEKMEELKNEKLEMLLVWCKNLPNRNMED
jgi:hypothetical protein